MLSGVWARYQLDMTDHTEYFKELSPKWLECGSFMPLYFGI